MNAAYKQILKATTLFGGAQGLNILINLVRTKLVAVLLGPAGVGLNAIYNETRELIHSTTNFGLDTSGIRNISVTYEKLLAATDDEHRKSIEQTLYDDIALLRSWVLILAVFGTFVTILLAQPLSFLTFNDASHTLPYIILSPIVGLSTLTCGEVTVLKGTRRLKYIATVSVLTTLLGACCSIPIYYQWGIDGVIPALIVIFTVGLLSVSVFSVRLYPLHFDFSKGKLKTGLPLIQVGTAFMLTNLIDNIIQLLNQSYLNNSGSLDVVGFYQTNNTLTATYMGVFLAALANDYYPRLSGVFSDKKQREEMVRDQVNFLSAILLPALLAMLILLPYLVPLLFSSEFIEVIPLTQLALLAFFFRAIHLPFTYTPLAAGESKTFFVLSTIQAVDMLLIIPGYYYGGLVGIGMTLLVTNIIDMTASMVCAWYKYHIALTLRSALVLVAEFAALGIAYIIVA